MKSPIIKFDNGTVRGEFRTPPYTENAPFFASIHLQVGTTSREIEFKSSDDAFSCVEALLEFLPSFKTQIQKDLVSNESFSETK